MAIELNTRNSDRNTVIDMMKGYGIVLVILGHVTRIPELHNFLYAFHMPLFFFLSGLTYKHESFSLQRKIRSLAIPYLFFSVITFTYWALVENRFREQYVDSNLITQQFLNIFYPMDIEGGYIFNVVLWFVPCLFVTLMIFHYSRLSMMGRRCLYCAIFCLVFILSFSENVINNIDLPFYIVRALLFLPYMMIGTCFKSILTDNVGVKTILSLVIIALLFIIIIWKLNPYHVEEFGGKHYPYYISYLIALMGIFSIVVISKVKVNRIILFLGKYSFVAMLIHEPIKRVVIKVYSMFIGVDIVVIRESIIHSIILTIVVTLVLLPIIKPIKEKAYFIFGYKK